MPINSFLYPGAKFTPPYSVANSLRFNYDSSDYLNKTLGTATNRKKFTISTWVKRSELYGVNSETKYLMSAGNNASTNIDEFYFRQDTLDFSGYESSTTEFQLRTNQLFRDPSAWLHIVVAYDSTQGTASNRIKAYANGSQITSFSTETYPDQNHEPLFNSNIAHEIGRNLDSKYFDGYMAEFVFIDGSALAPTDFGEFDSDTPTIWRPIDVSDLTFGNNGFYLDFEDSSNLGNDANGGTDLTETSLAATDQSTDTCTNNFCTFNPLDVTADDEATLSEGNLKAVADGAFHQTRSTFYLTTGKWYWEFKATSVGDALQGGVVGSNYAGGSGLRRNYQHSAAKYTDGNSSSYGATFTDGDIIGVALDLDNGTLIFYKNGSTQGTAFTDMLSAIGEDGWTPDVIMYNSTAEMNFGSPSYSESGGNSDANGHGNFAGSVPSGYFALCTKNLAESG